MASPPEPLVEGLSVSAVVGHKCTMTKFVEVRYRDCGWCGTNAVAMLVRWSDYMVQDAQGAHHSWAALSCPRCGNVTLVSLDAQVAGGQRHRALVRPLPDGRGERSCGSILGQLTEMTPAIPLSTPPNP